MSTPADFVFATGWVGGPGGGPFNFNRVTEGQVTQQLEFWKSQDSIAGFQLKYSDGTSSDLKGGTRNESAMLDLAPGERVVKFSMWDNGKTSGRMTLGKILIHTDKGTKFEFGVGGGTVEYPQDVGSGLLVGAFGSSGTEIDHLGLLFLNGVRRVSIDIPNGADGWGDNLIGSGKGISMITLDEQSYSNPQGQVTPWMLSGTKEDSVSSEYSQTATKQWGITSEVSAGFLGIGVKESATWTQEKSTTTTTSNTSTSTFSWSIGNTMDNEKKITATAIAYKGSLDIDYNSVVTVLFTDGKSFSYKEKGAFKNVQYSKVEAGWVVDSVWPPPQPTE